MFLTMICIFSLNICFCTDPFVKQPSGTVLSSATAKDLRTTGEGNCNVRGIAGIFPLTYIIDF